MEEYQNRVIEERDELESKIGKLSLFIKGKKFDSIRSDEQFLLELQKIHMICYCDILNSRIDRF